MTVKVSEKSVDLQYKVFVPAGLIPKRELYAVPEPQLVVDGAEIVFDDVLSGADLVGDLFILESLSDEFDDSLLSLAWISPAVSSSEHSCLLYKLLANFTRLTPPLIPKRVNRRLKCAFTVRRAMFSCLEISSLSQPCRSSSTTCRSLGLKYVSSTTHLFPLAACYPDARGTGTKKYNLRCLLEITCTCFAMTVGYLLKNWA